MQTPLFSAIEIEINRHCNRRCSYCPNSLYPRGAPEEMQPALLEALLAQLRDLQFSGRVSYDFYNEPLLHSDFASVVEKTRKYLTDARIEIYTNGDLLTRAQLENLVKWGADSFIVTRHEGSSPYPFQKVHAELPEPLLTKVTYRRHDEIQKTNRGGALPTQGAAGPKHAICQIPSMMLTIDVNGNVISCFEDFHRTQIMGNIRKSLLIDIWNSQEYVRYRNTLLLGRRDLYLPCSKCNRLDSLAEKRSE